MSWGGFNSASIDIARLSQGQRDWIEYPSSRESAKRNSGPPGRATEGTVTAERFWRWAGPLSFGIAVGLLFGRLDFALTQRGPLLLAVSNVASLWLALAFLLGLFAGSRKHAALCGGIVLLAALFGYYDAMHLANAAGLFVILHASKRWLFAALLSGPFYGILGYVWRTRQHWFAAVALIVPFLVEPVAWAYRLHPVAPQHSVLLLEAVSGAGIACVLIVWSFVGAKKT